MLSPDNFSDFPNTVEGPKFVKNILGTKLKDIIKIFHTINY